MLDDKTKIEASINAFRSGPLSQNAFNFFNALGYGSDGPAGPEPDTAEGLLALAGRPDFFKREKARPEEWASVHLLFRLADPLARSDVRPAFDSDSRQPAFDSDSARPDTDSGRGFGSYLFFAVQLRKDSYSRAALADITREINRLFDTPALVLFKHGGTLTLSVVNRRLQRGRDAGRGVLEKVTLVKDIRVEDPHRAHVELLSELALPRLVAVRGVTNFVGLHDAWLRTLDISELNKRFYKDLTDWYFWALGHVKFPPRPGVPDDVNRATNVIRLITRLTFVWFLKERQLVPDELFRRETLESVLKDLSPGSSTFYKAVLQNLFFATLDTPTDDPENPRGFRTDAGGGRRSDERRAVLNRYRHRKLFRDPEAALRMFAPVPFLDGGLFECLDRREEVNGKLVETRVDGFSDLEKNQPTVPNRLFFCEEHNCADEGFDLNAVYGTRNKHYRVRGLIDTLDRYKFTVAENTPIEEEVALDPELMGRVFENLLASYNPETGATARKQTGSFYTPREIVNYMVDESLIAYLGKRLALARGRGPGGESSDGQSSDGQSSDSRLRRLFAYTDEPHGFTEGEVETLVRAIDEVKILDPACGSGAYPMGILGKLVFVLARLDPQNARWKEAQLKRVEEGEREAAGLRDGDAREGALAESGRRRAEIEEAFGLNEPDHGRKLFLVRNCIYGVDIQPVAIQISKLRFFISLVADQRIRPRAENMGVRPLPSLATKFVAANALLGVEKPAQGASPDEELRRAVGEKERELRAVRERHFAARTTRDKEEGRRRDERLRREIGRLLEEGEWPPETAAKLDGWDPYDQNAAADFFDPGWMFGVRDGFDVVIGNPPYVRHEQLVEFKQALRAQYQCFAGAADLYVYFYERGLRLLKAGGVLSYVSSNKYFRSGYGAKLRALLVARTRVRRLIDFGDAPVFAAMAYPSIIVATKEEPDGSETRALAWKPGQPLEEFARVFSADSFTVGQKELTADGWRLEETGVLRLLDKLRAAGRPLGEYVGGRLYRGILTGLNEAFVVDRATRDALIAEDPSSKEILKPFLRGRDVKRWLAQPQDLWLIFTRRGVDIKQYPAVEGHLKKFKRRLAPGASGGRKAGSYKWFEIQDNIAFWEEFEKPKVVIPAIERDAEYAVDVGGHFSNDKTSICVTDSPHYLAGLLNSRVLLWFVMQVASTKRGGFYEFKPMYVSQLPIAEATAKQRSAINKLVGEILAARREDPNADASGLEREIDRLVYRLYDLTPAEVEIVEAGARRQAPARR